MNSIITLKELSKNKNQIHTYSILYNIPKFLKKFVKRNKRKQFWSTRVISMGQMKNSLDEENLGQLYGSLRSRAI